MRELVEYIIKHIVDNPEEVKVQKMKGEKVIFLESSVAKEDIGKASDRVAEHMKEPPGNQTFAISEEKEADIVDVLSKSAAEIGLN